MSYTYICSPFPPSVHRSQLSPYILLYYIESQSLFRCKIVLTVLMHNTKDDNFCDDVYVKFSPLTTSVDDDYILLYTQPTAIIPPTTRVLLLFLSGRSRPPVSRHAPHSFASVTLWRRSNFSRCLCPPRCVYIIHTARACVPAEYNNKRRRRRLEILLSAAAAAAAARLSYAVKQLAAAWRWSTSAGRVVVRCRLRGWWWLFSLQCSEHTLTFPKRGWAWFLQVWWTVMMEGVQAVTPSWRKTPTCNSYNIL